MPLPVEQKSARIDQPHRGIIAKEQQTNESITGNAYYKIRRWVTLTPCRKCSGERTVPGYRTPVRYKTQFDTTELGFSHRGQGHRTGLDPMGTSGLSHEWVQPKSQRYACLSRGVSLERHECANVKYDSFKSFLHWNRLRPQHCTYLATPTQRKEAGSKRATCSEVEEKLCSSSVFGLCRGSAPTIEVAAFKERAFAFPLTRNRPAVCVCIV